MRWTEEDAKWTWNILDIVHQEMHDPTDWALVNGVVKNSRDGLLCWRRNRTQVTKISCVSEELLEINLTCYPTDFPILSKRSDAQRLGTDAAAVHRGCVYIIEIDVLFSAASSGR